MLRSKKYYRSDVPPVKYYGSEVKNYILTGSKEFLVNKELKRKVTITDMFCSRQEDLTGNPLGFRYLNCYYVHSENPFVSQWRLNVLHPSLHEDFDKELTLRKIYDKRLAISINVITSALNFMGRTADLNYLLPSCITSVLPSLVRHPDAECSLTPEGIEAFITTHQKDLQILKEHFVMQHLQE